MTESDPNLHEQKGVDREGAIREFQNRLVLLNHAANCPYSNRMIPKPCRGFPSCYEMSQLLKHVNNCDLNECALPHCVSTRYLLKHNKFCVKEDCLICKPLKESIKRKSERSRQVVTVLKRKREDDYLSMEEVSPLSTPRFESDFEEEVRRKRRIECLQSNTSGESESDTASQISSTIYQALASECFAMDQADDILETMNECLNIPPQLIQQSQNLRQPPLVPTLALGSLGQPPLCLFQCYKCTNEISKGYRYYCELCNLNMCMGCFHCEEDLLHEHPIRALKVESNQQKIQTHLPPLNVQY